MISRNVEVSECFSRSGGRLLLQPSWRRFLKVLLQKGREEYIGRERGEGEEVGWRKFPPNNFIRRGGRRSGREGSEHIAFIGNFNSLRRKIKNKFWPLSLFSFFVLIFFVSKTKTVNSPVDAMDAHQQTVVEHTDWLQELLPKKTNKNVIRKKVNCKKSEKRFFRGSKVIVEQKKRGEGKSLKEKRKEQTT